MRAGDYNRSVTALFNSGLRIEEQFERPRQEAPARSSGFASLRGLTVAPDCPECGAEMRRWNKSRRAHSGRNHSFYAKPQYWICPEMERRQSEAARDEYGRWLRPEDFGHERPDRVWTDEEIAALNVKTLGDTDECPF